LEESSTIWPTSPRRDRREATISIEDQFDPERGEKPQLAKVYGFAYEGTYYDLPTPVIFLVHGPGQSATEGNSPGNLASRAPNDPDKNGVGAADFQIANDIMVWNYDKADQTMRMDVMTGMLEQVLLDIYFGFDSPAISGAKVSGAKVSGAKVSGRRSAGPRRAARVTEQVRIFQRDVRSMRAPRACCSKVGTGFELLEHAKSRGQGMSGECEWTQRALMSPAR